MIEEKKKSLERKEAKKIKELKKKEWLNLTFLRREIFDYQFRFTSQSSWNKSFSYIEEHNITDIRNKGQHDESRDVRE